MNSCDHKPQFNWKTVFMRKPQFLCSICGEKLQMTKPFQTSTRITNGLLIALLFLVAMTSGNGSSAGTIDWNQMAVEIGIMIGIVLLYLLLQILLIRFAKYELVPVSEVKDISEVQMAKESIKKPVYTPEQIEIMEMYAAAERQSRIDAGKDPETSEGIETAEGTEGIERVEKIGEPFVDACSHIPTKSWKNYIPSKADFTCEKCGKPITFTPAIKKNMSILLMVVTFLILMPNFIDVNVSFLKFGLLSLLVLAIAAAIQIFFVKRGHFVLKDPKDQKR